MQTGPQSIRSETFGSEDVPLIERIAEEILERQRAGQKPTVEEYCLAYPEHAQDLRSFLPALLLVEGLKSGSQESGLHDAVPKSHADLQHQQIGNYRILSELGRGGMGIVYEAEQQSLGRRVALKILLNHVASDEQAKQRFESEARSAARMHHTNIVPVFEVGSDKNCLFYAMQLIPGQSLDRVIDDLRRLRDRRADTVQQSSDCGLPGRIARSLISGEFSREQFGRNAWMEATNVAASTVDQFPFMREPVDTVAAKGSVTSAMLPGKSDIRFAAANRPAYYMSVARIGQQTADALAYAHARGIIHRDIKPSNLLLDGNGIVWITDFGLAKSSEQDLTNTGDILGTIRYMSPERFRGSCDERADVYSLGLTLYELIALRPAFVGSDHLSLINQIEKTDPVSPRILDSAVPRDLETIVLKSIDKDPRHRYPSAAEMADDLQRFIDDEPIRARRASLSERFLRWARHNRALAGATAATAALLIAVTIASVLIAGHFYELETVASRTAMEKTALAKEKSVLADQMKSVAHAAEQANYFNTIALADFEWKNTNVERAKQLLESCSVEQRHWEWDYLNHKFHNSAIAEFQTQASERTFISFSDDGQSLLASAGNRVVQIKPAEGMQHARYDRLNGRIDSWAVSRDRSTIAVASARQVIVHDLQNGHDIAAISPESDSISRYRAVAVSHDGRQVAALEQLGVLKLWDLSNDTSVTFDAPNALYGDLLFTRQGHLLAGLRHKWYLLDTTTGKRICEASGHHSGDVHSVALSPDEKIVASAGSGKRLIRLWELATGRELHRLYGHTDDVTGLDFHPSGKNLVSCSRDRTVRVWNTETGNVEAIFRGHVRNVSDVHYSPDGETFASIDGDGCVRLWNAGHAGDRIRIRLHKGQLTQMKFLPDGERLLTSSHDGDLKLIHLRQRIAEQTYTTGTAVMNFALEDQSQTFLSINYDETLRRWNSDSGEPAEVLRAAAKPSAEHSWGLDISPDGQVAVMADADGQLELVALDSGRSLLAFDWPCRRVLEAAFHPSGKFVAAATVGQIVYCSVESGGVVRHLTNEIAYCTSLRFDTDGKFLAATCREGFVYVWDVATGKLRFKTKCHAQWAMRSAFSPDGRRLATAGHDGTVKLWDPSSGQAILSLETDHVNAETVAFSPDGRLLAAGDGSQGQITLWSTDDRLLSSSP